MRRHIDLSAKHGPLLRTGDLAYAVGLSAQTIRQEIQSGEIKATRMGPAKKEFRIAWDEARRYARQIGALAASA